MMYVSDVREDMSMRRTQIYLNEKQHAAVQKLARRQKRTLSHVIRAAIDTHLKAPAAVPDWKEAALSVAGLWRDRPEVVAEVLAARDSLERDPVLGRE
jgi:predicted transcriptional regulator